MVFWRLNGCASQIWLKLKSFNGFARQSEAAYCRDGIIDDQRFCFCIPHIPIKSMLIAASHKVVIYSQITQKPSSLLFSPQIISDLFIVNSMWRRQCFWNKSSRSRRGGRRGRERERRKKRFCRSSENRGNRIMGLWHRRRQKKLRYTSFGGIYDAI